MKDDVKAQQMEDASPDPDRDELGKADRRVLPHLVSELLEVRSALATLRKRDEALTKTILPMLEELGGEYVDEDARQKIILKPQVRWEYEPSRLHWLVGEHLLTEAEFAECLKTVVDKAVVEGWLKKNLITDRHITLANAKELTRIVRQIHVEPIGGKRS